MLYVELAGGMELKYFAGICWFGTLGDEGKGKKNFPEYCVRRNCAENI